MKRLILVTLCTGLIAAVAGCDSLLAIVSSNTVTVRLVNTTDYPVDVEVFISDDDDARAALITELGDEIQRTVPGGMTSSFSRTCEELQAIIIDDANLQLILGWGPDADSSLLLDGEHFHCGDTITFTFTYTELTMDFDIDVDVS